MGKVKPIEDAPFHIYLKLLRENGYEEDADISESLYVNLLTTIKNIEGNFYTREQIMKTPFKNLVKASDLILKEAEKEVKEKPRPVSLPSGKALAGTGAENLDDETLRRVVFIQNRLHEENKIKVVT